MKGEMKTIPFYFCLNKNFALIGKNEYNTESKKY